MAALGLTRYRAVLARPGLPRLVVADVVVCAAAAMTPVAFVLFVRAATGSFATAGLVLGAQLAGSVAVAPLRGRWVDRAGPRRVLFALALPGVATDAALILAVRAGGGTVALVLVALVSGAVAAPASSALRAIFGVALGDGPERAAGIALMTLINEAGFLGGPLLAALITAAASPTAAIAAAAVLTLLGVLTVATAPATHAVARRVGGRGRLGPLGSPAVRGVVVTAGCFGATFGALDVALPAAARHAGAPAGGGVLLAAIALGIAAGGAAYGARASAPPVRAYVPGTLLALVALLPLLALGPMGLLLAAALVAGAGAGPITVVQSSAIDAVAGDSVAEAYAWVATLYGTGAAAGAALAGVLVEHVALRAGPLLAVAAMGLAALVAWRTVGSRA